MDILTINKKTVRIGKLYELEYKYSGDSYRYGVGWINSETEDREPNQVDILCYRGGMTYRNVDDVIFLKQYSHR